MRPLNILLVDDERMEREGLAYLCRRLLHEFAFSEASNGKAALELLSEQPFDIVIVDIRMPVMGGLEFLEVATREHRRRKYIIYSAHSDFEYAREAINLRVEDYLVKPIEEEEFFQLMNRVIDRITAEQHQAWHELINRALRGLSEPHEEAQEALGQAEGIALLLYLEKPVLEDKSELLKAIITQQFPGAHVLIGNEQEGYVVRFGPREGFSEGLQQLVPQINQQLGSGCQVVVTQAFRGYQEMKERLQEARQLTSRGFFTRDNVIITVPELLESRDSFDFFETQEGEAAQKSSAGETIRYIMRGLEHSGDYSNIYTKYMLVKEVERYARQVPPQLIEKMLASRSIREFREAVEQIVVEHPREISITKEAKAYIHANYSRDIAIDDIADHVFLNSNYLCSVFKKETGMTLIAYLTEYRMNQAMALVSGTLMRVSDIARKVGYRNPSYFNMIFKNHFGNTPTAFRKGEP